MLFLVHVSDPFKIKKKLPAFYYNANAPLTNNCMKKVNRKLDLYGMAFQASLNYLRFSKETYEMIVQELLCFQDEFLLIQSAVIH